MRKKKINILIIIVFITLGGYHSILLFHACKAYVYRQKARNAEDLNEAITYYKKGLKATLKSLPGNKYKFYKEIGIAYYMKSDFNNSIYYLNKAIKTWKHGKFGIDEVYYYLGHSYYKKGLRKKAIENLEKAVLSESLGYGIKAQKDLKEIFEIDYRSSRENNFLKNFLQNLDW